MGKKGRGRARSGRDIGRREGEQTQGESVGHRYMEGGEDGREGAEGREGRGGEGRGGEGRGAYGSVSMVHVSQFTIHSSRFTIRSSRFTIHGSQFTVDGSRFAERERGKEGEAGGREGKR